MRRLRWSRSAAGWTALLACLVALGVVRAPTARSDAGRWSEPCALAESDSQWTAIALAGWERASRAGLGAPAVRLPVLVLFDSLCAHTLTPSGSARGAARFVAGAHRFAVASQPHEGTVRLPDGDSLPARLISFASPMPDGGMYFVMALPSVWRASGRASPGDVLATAVFVHEFSHTQSRVLNGRVDSLIRRGLPESADDDVIQSRFADRPGFRRAYEAERDLLLAAAAAPTRADAVAAARKALGLIDRRRARYFKGEEAIYAEAEDLFLSMEGIGQWMAYRWLVDDEGGGMSAAEALPFMRRGGRRWSQDEGLAILLVLHRLDPGAPARLFGDRPSTVLPLLRAALERSSRPRSPR